MNQHYKNTIVVDVHSRKEWRQWLQRNHEKEKSAWLVIYHKHSGKSTLDYAQAVEEALCFRWIDSVANKRDQESAYQYFSQRKPESKWSRSNRERVERLINDGLMTDAGQALIDYAMANGNWEALEDVQNNILPEDLQQLLKKNKKAEQNFNAFPPPSKRMILGWIQNAKKEETRKKRIEETVALAEKNIKANHPLKK